MNQREQTTWHGIRVAAIAIAVLLIGAMAAVGLSALRVRPAPTPTKTPTAVGEKTSLPVGGVTVVAIATGTPPAADEASVHTPTPTTTPVIESTPTVDAVATGDQSTATADQSTATPAAVSQSNQSPLPSPTATTPATAIPLTTMYVCGYDRCRDSDAYGDLSFETGISVWENPEPDRGEVVRELVHGDEVQVIAKKRIYDGPGGLWYQLEGGGWIDNMWITELLCTPGNLPELSFDRCSGESD